MTDRVLCDGRVWTPAGAAAYAVHPVNAGRVLTMFRLDGCGSLRPVGHDGATIDRFPAIAPGHINTNPRRIQ